MIEYLSGQELEDILTEDVTIVDFFAEWCSPCKMLSAVFEEMENIKIIKINVDDHEELAQKHGVMSIPTVEIYKNKKLVNKFIGYKSKEEIEEIIANSSD